MIFISFLSSICNAYECKKLEDHYNYYFINGVGNNVDSIGSSLRRLKLYLGLKKDVTPLTNPKNLGPGNEIFPGWFSSAPSYGEIKEVFSQKEKKLVKRV